MTKHPTLFAENTRATAMIETAILLPLFLMLLLGILIYGQYFLLAHSVQQAANDGARAAITGLDAADRRAVAIRAIDRSMTGVGGYRTELRSVLVSETTDAVTVELAYHVPETSLLRSTFVPMPGDIISARATFELPAE
ncbi:MAG: pilus assembly protein [Sphingopyxis sp.]|nr:pilus assembly protein [Sphingopyxis sp.]